MLESAIACLRPDLSDESGEADVVLAAMICSKPLPSQGEEATDHSTRRGHDRLFPRLGGEKRRSVPESNQSLSARLRAVRSNVEHEMGVTFVSLHQPLSQK
jgi:hypothetical protein